MRMFCDRRDKGSVRHVFALCAAECLDPVARARHGAGRRPTASVSADLKGGANFARPDF
mgnify:CR=1 FL=1